MQHTNSRYRINETQVTSKLIDGEAIVINLANGMYYSLDKIGAAVWQLIGGSYSTDEIAGTLSARFKVSAEQVKRDLEPLIADLLKQKLILTADGNAKSAVVELDASTGDAYEAPVLNSYDDMGDVLALDPPLPQVEIENESWESGR